ncbi:hypothetical protein [Plasticicumulans sp.]|uniref:hypothetical protein n=1 Tax=Plasticicumulans sp. TaxID=2307179 RepID=UPI000FAE0540|nr:hypothetical protein [Plasticicumulans sp.]MBS0601580.1 hypothetical protein [Pseudomonadota bacterium]RTL05834.1 MAG: hypothetical protein EKK65_00640 [Xanthomonadales bacterium]HMV40754.1 hypothetical protein [Plasticicumulans sp.]HMW30536.1 hypothetical protein [Plasticicumulans sp.]HMW42278.1 hypothetical protein [Plasticicumulans sp.]
MGKKGKKKDRDEEAKFVIRIEKDLRDEFVDLCRDLDTTASREVRRFIRSYLAENGRGASDAPPSPDAGESA